MFSLQQKIMPNATNINYITQSRKHKGRIDRQRGGWMDKLLSNEVIIKSSLNLLNNINFLLSLQT